MRFVPAALLILGLLGCPTPDDTAKPDDTQPDTDPTEVRIDGVEWDTHEEIESLVTVTFDQLRAAQAWIEFKPVEDEDWMLTPAQDLAVGQASFLLLGLPYGYDFEFRVANDFGDGPLYSDSFTGAVPAAPSSLPLTQLHVYEPDLVESTGRFLLSSVNANTGGWVAGDYWKIIIDRKGRTVWALETPSHLWTTFTRVALNGEDLLYDQFSYWAIWDSGAASQVHRIKIDGTHLESYATPGAHHAFTELRDGSLVWGAASWSTETLEKRNPDGSQETLWDCGPFHDALGITSMCQSNTVTWDEATDTFLLSFYTTDTLVHIDHATGETLRVFGEAYGDFAFDPETSAFAWQHGGYWTEAGTLLLSTHRTDVPDEELETVAREYELDDETMTLHQIWSFGEGGGLHAHTAGEALRLPNGNTLHNYGSFGRLREVTPDGTIVWDVDWRIDLHEDYDRLIGRTTFLEDLYAFAP
jgi:hypothetical protein